MVLEAHTTAYVQTVMIEFGTTAFAQFAVFGRYGLHEQAVLAHEQPVRLTAVHRCGRRRLAHERDRVAVGALCVGVELHQVAQLVRCAVFLFNALFAKTFRKTTTTTTKRIIYFHL